MGAPEVAIIGGGIVGCAAAAFLAQAGASVTVFEREVVGSGASGRNQGMVQHPFDPLLTVLFGESLAHYRALSAAGVGFTLSPQPDGLLLVGRDPDAVAAEAVVLERALPELRPSFLGPDELRSLEPSIAPSVAACRLETGYCVPPGAATAGFAELARRHGVRFELGREWRPRLEGARVAGVETDGRRVPAGRVIVAAGAWSSDVLAAGGVGGPAIRIRPLWGVVASVALADPPRHPLEEVGVDRIMGSDPEAGLPDVPSLFSLVTARGRTGLGATRLPERPDERAIAALLVDRGAAFVPSLARAAIVATRSCPRPMSADGRPLLGVVPGVERLFMAAGHGPWGISTGPASARLVADLVLERGVAIPSDLSPARFSQGASHAA